MGFYNFNNFFATASVELLNFISYIKSSTIFNFFAIKADAEFMVPEKLLIH